MNKISFVLFICIFSLNSYSANFTTNFESTNFNTIQTFSINSSGLSASFSGGTSFTIGNGALYHSGTKSWMIDPAGTTSRGTSSGSGTITLPDEVEHIDFYIRTSNSSSTGQVQIIDASDAVIEDITSTIVNGSWLHIEKQITTGSPAIKSILVNAFGSNMLAIDDLSFSTPASAQDETNDTNTASTASSSSGGSLFYLAFLIIMLNILIRTNNKNRQ